MGPLLRLIEQYSPRRGELRTVHLVTFAQFQAITASADRSAFDVLPPYADAGSKSRKIGRGRQARPLARPHIDGAPIRTARGFARSTTQGAPT
jgi:hypothetical protein